MDLKQGKKKTPLKLSFEGNVEWKFATQALLPPSKSWQSLQSASHSRSLFHTNATDIKKFASAACKQTGLVLKLPPLFEAAPT